LALIGALGMAVASYILVERPMLRLRDRRDARRRFTAAPSSAVVAQAA
jgi:peptidoglycan/LPS O-acetylase OafA/YrhL